MQQPINFSSPVRTFVQVPPVTATKIISASPVKLTAGTSVASVQPSATIKKQQQRSEFSSPESHDRESEYWKKKYFEADQANASLRVEVAQLQREAAQREAVLLDSEKKISDLELTLKLRSDHNEALRQEKTAVQVESYKAKQAELALRESEMRLAQQVKTLAETTEGVRRQAELERHVQQTLARDEVERVKNLAEGERNVLESRIQAAEAQTRERERALEDLRRTNSALQVQLLSARAELDKRAAEQRVWQHRASSAEKEKEFAVKLANRDKEQSVALIERERSVERQVLQQRIAALETAVSTRTRELRDNVLSLAETQQKQRELEIARLHLQGAVQELERRAQLEADRFNATLRVKDVLHEREVDVLRKSQEIERGRLRSNLSVVERTAEDRGRALISAQNDAQNLARQLSLSNERERQKSLEAEAWRTCADRVVAQKQEQVAAAHQLREAQVQQLRRSQEIERTVLEKQKSGLVGALVQKDAEIKNLATQAARATATVAQKERSLSVSQAEIEAWRAHAQQVEALKNAQLLQEQQLRASQTRALQNQQVYQTVSLKNQIADLNFLLKQQAVQRSRPVVRLA